MSYGYQSCINAGWKDGIHDCRPFRYEHPWLVIYRGKNGASATGCYSRGEARRLYAELKRGMPIEATHAARV